MFRLGGLDEVMWVNIKIVGCLLYLIDKWKDLLTSRSALEKNKWDKFRLSSYFRQSYKLEPGPAHGKMRCILSVAPSWVKFICVLKAAHRSQVQIYTFLAVIVY